ncbi:MAG: hypothetical protein AB1453_02975 [Chloroflexota bacterium]
MFAWYDLWTLYRYRDQAQCLDTTLALTRGSPVGAWGVLDHLRLDKGSATCVLRSGNGTQPLIGQVRYSAGERSARLAFVLPARGVDSLGVTALLEGLAQHAGAHGSHALLAEVEESSPLFEGLRRAGFGVFTWQRIWRINAQRQEPGDATIAWQPTSDLDHMAVRSLAHTLIPLLAQSAEPLPNTLEEGWVFTREQEVLAYAAPVYGPRGIVIQPLLHPAVEDVPALLHGLIAALPLQLGRPVYLVVRAYQSWLEPALEGLGAESGERQAVLVKHLTVAQRKPVFATLNNTLEKHQPAMLGMPGNETPLPLVQHKTEESLN